MLVQPTSSIKFISHLNLFIEHPIIEIEQFASDSDVLAIKAKTQVVKTSHFLTQRFGKRFPGLPSSGTRSINGGQLRSGYAVQPDLQNTATNPPIPGRIRFQLPTFYTTKRYLSNLSLNAQEFNHSQRKTTCYEIPVSHYRCTFNIAIFKQILCSIAC